MLLFSTYAAATVWINWPWFRRPLRPGTVRYYAPAHQSTWLVAPGWLTLQLYRLAYAPIRNALARQCQYKGTWLRWWWSWPAVRRA
jgi:hypothetical protein